jgi:hypothetical protein
MVNRVLPLCLVALALALFLSMPALADEKAVAHEGTFVSFSNNKLVMADKDGKEHSHTLAKDAKITLDGKPAKCEDFKKGVKITVTTPENDPTTAIQVAAKSE